MITYLNSKSYTVADLKAIADRMGIKVPAGSRKAEIAELIVGGIDSLHAAILDDLTKIEAVDEVLSEAFPPSIETLDEDYRETLTTDKHAEFWQADSEARQAEIKLIDVEYWARYRTERRINNYIRSNGTDKLTPGQWRRVRKGLRKGNLALRDLSVEFV